MARCNECSDGVGGVPSIDSTFRRILWAALIVNGVMFGVEAVAGLISGSVSLQADALDFFGDAINYAITLFVLGTAVQARAKAALFKGASMGLFGLWVIGSTAYKTVTGTVPDAAVMGIIGLLALIANVGVAVMLFRYRQGDSNMRSIWLCSRNDALGNIAVILAASGVFVTATAWPDIIVAAVIAGLNLTAAQQVFRQALGELKMAPTSIGKKDEVSVE